MASRSMPSTPQEVTGRNPASSFPGPSQRVLFRDVRPSWMTFLSWLVGRDPKGFAEACYPNTPPDQTAESLGRILTGRHKRHFAIEWLDHLARLGGAEAAREIVAFVCDRYGYLMPARKPD